jgi:hypothetical protein
MPISSTSRKKPIEVSAVGSLESADLRGLARVLLQLRQQPKLRIVTNEQSGSHLPAQQQRPE